MTTYLTVVWKNNVQKMADNPPSASSGSTGFEPITAEKV